MSTKAASHRPSHPAQHHKPRTISELTQQNVSTVARIDDAIQAKRGIVDRVVDSISNFTGSLKFIWLHVVWFGFWVIWNLAVPAGSRFDPYPFGLLTMIVSLEAILLSTIIMISQNRQARQSDLHNSLNLQISLLSEQENTKVLNMLDAICRKLQIPPDDPDVGILEQATSPDQLVHQIEEIIERQDHRG